MSASEPSEPSDDDIRGPLFWTLFIVGWAAIGFGVWSVFHRAGSVHPLRFAAWLVGLTLAHDLLIAPAISLAAMLLVPRLRPRGRGVILVATIVSAVLVLIALPALLGNPEGNDTILPRNYVAGLAVALVVTWVAAGAWFVVARVRSERAS